MKKLRFSLVLLFGLIGVLPCFSEGKPTEFKKVIMKEFPLSSSGLVKMKNIYGEVKVEGSTTNTVEFHVTIIADCKDKKVAEELFGRINIEFENEADFVSYSASVEERAQGFWSWIKSTKSTNFSINVDVKMPASAKLNLANRYGDSFARDLNSDQKYEVKYGNLYVDGCEGNTTLNLGYGDAKISETNTLNADIKYAELKCNTAESAKISSKYSDVFINYCNSLNVSSRYDDYTIERVVSFTNDGKYDDMHIESVDEIKMNTAYADLEIGYLHRMADLNFRFGDIVIERLKNDFQKIAITGSYADCVIDGEGLKDYDLEFAGVYSNVHGVKGLDLSKNIEDGSKREVAGRAGQGGRVIRVKMSYGDLKLNKD